MKNSHKIRCFMCGMTTELGLEARRKGWRYSDDGRGTCKKCRDAWNRVMSPKRKPATLNPEISDAGIGL